VSLLGSVKNMKLVVASTNVHKIREYRSMLKKVPGLDLFSLLDYPGYLPPAEDGDSFEANAAIKAERAAKELGVWALADDSGLVVPALGGAPGIHSARYAGPTATDRENRRKLLLEMRDLTDPERQAYFECCIVLCSPEGIMKCVRGCCEGFILHEERGRYGFGYDPIFVKHEYRKTFAELDEDVKNRISHRRKAIDKILLYLEALAQQPPSECTT